MERVKSSGGSSDDADRLLKQHEKDIQTLESNIKADKMRLKSHLEERLKQKRKQRLEAKKSSVDGEVDQQISSVNSDTIQACANIKNQEVE